MVLYDSIWQDCQYTGRSTGAYILFYLGRTIYNCTHVPDIVTQSSHKSEYNAACTAVMNLEYSRMLNN